MKKLFCIFCLMVGIFSEGSSFAAQKKDTARAKTGQEIEFSIASETLFEEKCMEEINRIRQEHGLRSLKKWPQLSDCAKKHSQNMAAGKCAFGHDGFNKRGKQMGKQANLFSFAENVAYNHHYDDPVQVAVDGWMESPGHKKNILGDDFEETGVGVAISKEGKVYFTQLFAKRYRSRSRS